MESCVNAAHYLRREQQADTLQPALVHDLPATRRSEESSFENRSHFYGVAARLMRQIHDRILRQRMAVNVPG
jgi:hypothetical protein